MIPAGVAVRANSPALTETISHRGTVVCMIVRAERAPDVTTFYTPHHYDLQVGKIVYSAGTVIPRHLHRPVVRHVVGTAEVLIVQKGRMILDLYDHDRALMCSRDLGSGDVVVLLGAGHGFRLLEDTVLLEVKQGPYFELQDKELF